MSEIYIVADNIVSPIGVTTGENFSQLTHQVSAIKLQNNTTLSPESFYAALFNSDSPYRKEDETYTAFEQLLIASISEALQNSGLPAGDKRTILIISSTKGNINLLENHSLHKPTHERIALPTSAKLIKQHFGLYHQPLIISNACISGLLAILTAKRLIASGQYDHVLVAGADIISKFVLSGFQSFQAISPEPCKPFDKERQGITLGEGAATVILSRERKNTDNIKIMAGAVSNDANHISAPSRTGNELAYIIKKAIKDSGLTANDINLVSAHGTATLYNDEMEAKAINEAGLGSVPTNSLKGYYGHTLGAAGLIETIISVRSLQEGIILPTKGFEKSDPSAQLTVADNFIREPLQNCIKTASGFGGCNAAMLFSKQ
ncbi:MAG: beta-ketoacyl synthase N-terminal-like domain-containing protein [Bacteroidota bacterium]